MGTEIERKFLTTDEAWRGSDPGTLYRQGYLTTDLQRVVRIRTMGERAVLTVKSQHQGPVRGEWEYEIPLADANELLNSLCLKPLIEKQRHRVQVGAHVWEVDEFFGDNAGLVVAEVELGHPDEELELPSWVGEEVTDDPRYLNVNLVKEPFAVWCRVSGGREPRPDGRTPLVGNPMGSHGGDLGLLQEMSNVDQTKPGLIRRWFIGSYFELIVWLDRDGEIEELQLCYDRKAQEKVLLWRRPGSYAHQQVDDGEDRPGRHKATPIFVPDGECDHTTLAERFRRESVGIDPVLAGFVYDRIREFRP